MATSTRMTAGSGARRASRIVGRLRARHRGRLPLVVLVAVCLVAATAAVSGAGTESPGLRFAQIGHWFAGPSVDTVFHVNGGTRTIDARVPIAGVEPDDQVVEGDTSGYVVGPTRIVQFGKSSLAVEQTLTPPAGERAVPVEARGGPYLVFPEAGSVVRLGPEPATITVGGPLGAPVAAPDGTLWLHRTGAGELCHLGPGADRVSCPAPVPAGPGGALTVVGDRVVFVDTRTDMLTVVDDAGLGPSRSAGLDLPPGAQVAGADLDGRIAVLDPGTHRMHLVDGTDRAAAAITVDLPPGTYAAPSAGRSSVAVLELRRGRLHTFDSAGRVQQVSPVPPGTGRPRLSRGQDGRLYVDGDVGRHVLVVDDGGRPGTVPLTGAGSSGPAAGPGTVPTRTPSGGNPTSPGRTDAPSRSGTSQTSSPPARDDAIGPPAGGPRAVPAGPPGMPPRVAATPRTDDLLVTWGAAAANGAAVTAYRVGWTADGGRGGSAVRPGGARSATLTGLVRGVSYRITVVAENSAGRSAPARINATLPRVPTVTVSRGATTTYETSCEPPECAFIRVELRGFEPNTRYEIDPFSSEWDDFNPGAELSTDDQGNLTVDDRFPFNGVNQTVWVVVDGTYQSNRYLWTAP